MTITDRLEGGKITRLWAWVWADEGGDEGTPTAVLYPGRLGPSPLVAVNEDQLRRITAHAEMIAGRWPGGLVLWEYGDRREVRRIGGPGTKKAPHRPEPAGREGG